MMMGMMMMMMMATTKKGSIFGSLLVARRIFRVILQNIITSKGVLMFSDIFMLQAS